MKKNLSKADILTELKSKLKKSYIEDIYVFTVEDWGGKEGTSTGASFRYILTTAGCCQEFFS